MPGRFPTGTFFQRSFGSRTRLILDADGTGSIVDAVFQDQDVLAFPAHGIVAFRNTSEPVGCATTAVGRYRWTVVGKGVRFTAVGDPDCAYRQTLLTREVWRPARG